MPGRFHGRLLVSQPVVRDACGADVRQGAPPNDRSVRGTRGRTLWGRSLEAARADGQSEEQSRSATARIHPALARSIFTGKQLSVHPVGGRAARLVNFSIW